MNIDPMKNAATESSSTEVPSTMLWTNPRQEEVFPGAVADGELAEPESRLDDEETTLWSPPLQRFLDDDTNA